MWARAAASDRIRRTGATRFAIDGWEDSLEPGDLDGVGWPDAGFTEAKRRYLERRYPLDDLPEDGCIRSWSTRGDVLYRRVDVTRGWLADCLYLRRVAEPVRFSCPTGATMHAVLASAVAPAVFEAGLWLGCSPQLRRTLGRAGWPRSRRCATWPPSSCGVDGRRRVVVPWST